MRRRKKNPDGILPLLLIGVAAYFLLVPKKPVKAVLPRPTEPITEEPRYGYTLIP